MIILDTIKSKLRDLLIEKEGNVKPWDLKDIMDLAKESNLDEKQVNKLLVEVDQSINWEAVRIRKEKNDIKAEKLKLLAKDQIGKNPDTKRTLSVLLEQFASDKILSIGEIKVYFETAKALNFDKNQAAKFLEEFLKLNDYNPQKVPQGSSLSTKLQSTDWQKFEITSSPIIQKPKSKLSWRFNTGVLLSIFAIGIIMYLLLFQNKQRNIREEGTISNNKIGKSGIFTDRIDGQKYKTVKIGNQVWMAENLKTTKFNDGTAIPLVAVNIAWGNLLTPGYCWYNNQITNKDIYGALYNWSTVNAGKLCPIGWHVPTDAEWKQLEMALGMTQAQADAVGWRGTDQGTQMKTTSGWDNNGNGINTSKFSALSGGYRDYRGNYNDMGRNTNWWSASEYSALNACRHAVNYNYNSVNRDNLSKAYGFSVRCVKDDSTAPFNQAPNFPADPAPADIAKDILTSTTFSWTCSDPENDPLAYDVYFGTSSNPTTKVSADQTPKNYSPVNLTAGTDYYWKIVAKDNKGNSTTGPIWKFTTTSSSVGTISDADGNTYSTVTIGTQVWMASNLKTTKYNDGTAIPLVTDNTAWTSLATPGYCWYNNQITNKDTYGALYNWYTVNTGKLCPKGWHVPTDTEWTVLTTYLGGESVAGGKLKETGTSHWVSPNTGATNTSGFTSLPGGYRDDKGTFVGNSVGYDSSWWSITEVDASNVWHRNINNWSANVYRQNYTKKLGESVRCLKFKVRHESK